MSKIHPDYHRLDELVRRFYWVNMLDVKAPKHIAFIMDGNGRWATARGLARLDGHRKGAETLEHIIRICGDMGVQHVTFYAFSTENWKRSDEEVSGLFKLMSLFFKKHLVRMKDEGIRLRVFGDISEASKLSAETLDIIRKVQSETAGNKRLNVNLCINYGGRDEILRAVKKCIESGQTVDGLSEDVFSAFLDSAGQPDPDIVIRTGGNGRISNFLLWQMAYAELFFTETSWPDFGKEELLNIIARFNGTERRFGAVLADNAPQEQ